MEGRKEGRSLPNTDTAQRSKTVTAPPFPLFSRGAWLCASLLVICLFAALPFAEIGVHDDWSYIYTALVYARSGHFVYNGWATAMLGWQILWGALFAKLFGPSFTAVRLSIVPVSLACAFLLHAILRRFGLNAALASFGTLTLCLLPPFFPMGETFMTDVPGLFSILLCLYLCQRALAARNDRAALLWLAVAALTNVLSGSVRQIAWLGALVVVPSCGWLLHKQRRRHAVPVTISLWLAGVVLIWLTMHWFALQPYSVPEKILPDQITLGALVATLSQIIRAVLTTLLFCLPVLVSGIAFIPRLRSRARWLALLWMFFILSIVGVLKLSDHWVHWRPFWMDDITSSAGLFPVVYGFDVRVPTLNPHFLDLLFLVLAISCVIYGVLLWQESPRQHPASSSQHSLSRRDTCVLLLPFLLAYCALLIPRAGSAGGIRDRYLLPIVVIVLYLLLRAYQDHIASRPPAVAFAVLVVMASLTVASTHDRFATSRASARLLDRLQASGVQRTEIAGGFEFDGWTQIKTAGYVNEPNLVNPPGAYVPPQKPYDPHAPCSINFLPWTPVIHAKYFLTQGLSPCFSPDPLMSTSFRTWLPPATRHLYIQRTLRSAVSHSQ